MADTSILDNKVRLTSTTMKETQAVTVSIWSNVGSRYESPETNGISHFLEHMAFKGTKTRSAKQIAEEFDNIGGILNAHTSREHTVYYGKVLKENFTTAADILSDIIQNSTFEQEEVEKERGVILQEIAMTNDTPDDIIFDHFQETAFSDQPIGRSILGPEEIIKKLQRDDFVNYVNNHYHGENIVVSVAGNIEHQQVVDFFSRNFTNLPKASNRNKEGAKYTGGIYTEEKDLEQVHFIMGFEGLAYTHDDIYIIQLLSSVLGGGMSSRLFQEIREKRGLAYSVSCYNSTYYDAGMFNVYAGTSPEQIDELVTVTCNELKKVAENIDDIELTRSKTQIKASLLMSRESSYHIADEMGRHLTCFNRHIALKEILEKIEAVSKQDICNMAQKILSSSKPTIAATGKISKLQDYNTICDLVA